MSPEELALIAKSPTFADLCHGVREARKAHNRAIGEIGRLEESLSLARVKLETARDAEDLARAALIELIARETALD